MKLPTSIAGKVIDQLYTEYDGFAHWFDHLPGITSNSVVRVIDKVVRAELQRANAVVVTSAEDFEL